MTVTNLCQTLANHLDKTRKSLQEACDELELPIDLIDESSLDQYIVECSHCGIWTKTPRWDQDDFPVCKLCFTLVGG
jgi:hypothetical protein